MEGTSKKITLVTSVYKGDGGLAIAIATQDDHSYRNQVLYSQSFNYELFLSERRRYHEL
jgi:hypothetical protein